MCQVCNNKAPFIDQVPYSHKYRYLVCGSCTAGILQPQPSEPELKKLYAKNSYFVKLSQPVKASWWKPFFDFRIFPLPDQFVSQQLSPRSILDVGCGNGEFLDNLSKLGWKTYGSDISQVAKANTEMKIGKNRVFRGEFSSQKIAKKFDVITFWHVLEHLASPIKYLKAAYRNLNKGGMVMGEVPSFDSRVLKIFRQNYSWMMVPEHRIYLSTSSLRNILKQSGFSNIVIKSPPRGLLNFSLSYSKTLEKSPYRLILFALSIPFSVALGLFFSKLGQGEVLRFSAEKDV